MMYLNKVRSFTTAILLLCCFVATSCGYFSDNPVEDADVYRTDELSAGCTLDLDSLSRILEEDIEKEIKCLEENFNRFTQYVRTRDDRSVSRGELELFIQKFFRNHSEGIISGIGILFELNMLFLKDEIDSISRGNISPLFSLIVKANKEAIIITDVFGKIDDEKEDFWKLREKLKASIERFSTYTISIITQKTGVTSNLNIREFVENLNRRLPELNIKPEMVNKFLFVKKLLLGGEAEIINNKEASDLIVKAPKVLILAFDIIYSDKRHFNNDQIELLNFYTEAISRLNDMLFDLKDNTFLFNVDDIYDIAENNIKDDEFDLKTYRQVIDAAKAHLIGGDPKLYYFADLKTALALVRALIEVVKVQTHYDQFQLSTLPYDQKMDILKSKFSIFQEMMTVLLFDRYIIRQDLNALDFAKAINPHFEQMNFDEEVLTSFFIAKTLLMGGDKAIITKTELEALLDKVPQGLEILVDVLNRKIENATERNEFLFQLVFKVEELLYQLADNEKLTDIDEILALADYFINRGSEEDDRINVKRFRPSIINVKEKVLGLRGLDFTGEQFKSIKDMVIDLVKKLYFNDITYEAHKGAMSLNRLITEFTINPSIPGHALFTKEEIARYTKEFLHITGNYRFYRNPEHGVQYVGPAIKRSKEGLLEISLLRFVVEKLAIGYGTPVPNSKKENRVSINQVGVILNDFKELLEEFGLWSPTPLTFARNTVLMGDLFQPQSNGDNHLGIDETTEYATLVLSAIKMANDFEKRIGHYCQTEYDSKFGIMIDCLKKHFFKVWLDENGMATYLPKLKSYVALASTKEAEEFFVNVTGFARDINDDSVPVNDREIILLIGALINIESTYTRFDTNNNNIIDPPELARAFELYRNSIIELAELEPSRHKYANSIFLYMIKNMSIPNTGQVLWFHNNPFSGKDDITALRLNIGALLYYLVNI